MRARPGSHGHADRHLAAASDGAGQQQIGDVGAGNEQHETHRADQHQKRRPHVFDESLADRLQAESLIRRQCGGEFPTVIGGGDLQAGLGLLECDAGLEAPCSGEVVALILGVGVQLKRQEDIRRGAKLAEIECGSDDADHHVRIAAQRDGFAQNLRIAGKAPLPATLAEDHHLLAFRQVLLLCERTSAQHRRAEEAEEVGTHLGGLKLFRKCASCQVDDAVTEGRHVLHDAGLFPPVLEFGGRRAGSRAIGKGVQEKDQAVRVGKRRGLQQDRVDHGENGGVGSDAERQRQYGGGCEPGTLAECAQRVLEILQKCFHF